jgi:7-carboxy-7-deazaguanine synthase
MRDRGGNEETNFVIRHSTTTILQVKISELFHSIQGEGKLVGVPSVFVRASGCNLRCVWCDTPYASWNPEGENLTIEQIVDRVATFPARHVVLTGGEPMIMPDIVALTESLKPHGYHITIETAATLFQPVKVDLASLSPKLSNSTPWQREGGRFAAAHEKQRLNFPVIQQFIDMSPAFQLKFVVASAGDLAEIDAVLSQLKGWQPADVLLMPEGTDAQTLGARAGWISEICKERGFRYCPRLHVSLYGNKRGT